MAVGLALLLGSWLVLLLMVIGQVPPGLLLSIGAYAVSLAGLVVGLFGVVRYVRVQRSQGEAEGKANRLPE